MSKEVFESIMAGLEDALVYSKGCNNSRGTAWHGTIWDYPKERRESPIKLSKEKPTKRQR